MGKKAMPAKHKSAPKTIVSRWTKNATSNPFETKFISCF